MGDKAFRPQTDPAAGSPVLALCVRISHLLDPSLPGWAGLGDFVPNGSNQLAQVKKLRPEHLPPRNSEVRN